MKNIPLNFVFANVLAISVAFPGFALSQQTTETTNIFSGHFSREGNNESPAKTINSNIYIKLFKDQWIATLFIPYPYASTVKPAAITKTLEQAKSQTTTSAYMRGNFGQLTELATVHVERYGHIEDRIAFECSLLAPCTIKFGDGFLELIKPGVINEHIVRYNHVLDQ